MTHHLVRLPLVLVAATLAAAPLSAAPAAKKPPALEVSDLKVGYVQMPFGSGGQYLKVEFDVTVNKKQPGMVMPEVKAVCLFAGKKLVENASSMQQLNEVEPGESVHVSVTPYVLHPFADSPTACELTVSAKAMFGGGTKLGQFCFTGDAVTAGACPTK